MTTGLLGSQNAIYTAAGLGPGSKQTGKRTGDVWTSRVVLFIDRKLPLNSFKMSYKGPPKVQKVMVQPINLIFRYLQNRSKVQVWLYENVNLKIEGHIVGFDEYMNLVLDDAEEVYKKSGKRKALGRIMMKGDNITLIQNVNPQGAAMQP
ncbi:hypothetical protein FOCC_FOCC008872 [Frankliniella occidentalis]|nr:hypothetical protein FOCC_FOCC008872 [Frankliniella occidentalis]